MQFDHSQMSRLDASVAAKLADRMTLRLRERHPASANAELRACVEAWIADAYHLGLRGQRQVVAWLERLVQKGQLRQPLEVRLPVYLVLYHESLLEGLDATVFTKRVCGLARSCAIHQEEGTAWLAVIVLAGHHRAAPLDWIGPMLQGSEAPEEERLRAVHLHARSLGWFAADGRIA